MRMRATQFTKLKAISHNLCKSLDIALYCPFVTSQHEWANNFPGFFGKNINGKVGKLVYKLVFSLRHQIGAIF